MVARDWLDGELARLIEGNGSSSLLAEADTVRRAVYGTDIYIRGLIELTNHCANNCYYCGIRRENRALKRYRLELSEVLACCEQGYGLGFRTFVLQGGEDPYFTCERVCELVSAIRNRYEDCAITLSLGEWSHKDYKAFFEAGANRYLLRHETANGAHFKQLHPPGLDLERRKDCLWSLKDIGYQVGSGFMVGSPFQTTETLIQDLRFLQRLQPQMIGIGPFVSQSQTPFSHYKNGDIHQCLRMVALARLMFPHALLPATTALGAVHEKGRIMGLTAGANVLMPNLTPVDYRPLYSLYNNKTGTGEETAEGLSRLKSSALEAGYQIVTAIGNPL